MVQNKILSKAELKLFPKNIERDRRQRPHQDSSSNLLKRIQH